MSEFMRETCITLFNDVLVHTNKGERYEVKFDFEHCWSIRKNYKLNKVTMIHVHPDNCLLMSSTDRNQVKGWALAFGVPIVYIVISKVNGEYLCIKYLVNLENNVPVIYRSSINLIQKGPLKLLINASRNLLLKDFYLYLLERKINSHVTLNKWLL